MATRATLADGTTFDYDEAVNAHPTHVNDQPVVGRWFMGPGAPEVPEVPEVPAESGEA